jgi:hypothetical protein
MTLPTRWGRDEDREGGAFIRFLREAALLAPLWAPLVGFIVASIGVGYHWIDDANVKTNRRLSQVDARLDALDAGQGETVKYLKEHTDTISKALDGEERIGKEIGLIEGHQAADEEHWASVDKLLVELVNKMIPDRRADDFTQPHKGHEATR